MNESTVSVSLPRADWELLVEFLKVHAGRQAIATDLWRSWTDEITDLIHEQIERQAAARFPAPVGTELERGSIDVPWQEGAQRAVFTESNQRPR